MFLLSEIHLSTFFDQILCLLFLRLNNIFIRMADGRDPPWRENRSLSENADGSAAGQGIFFPSPKTW